MSRNESNDLDLDITDEKSSPLGTWNDLNPKFWKQVQALIKKQFLVKFRHPAAIIEIMVSFLLCFVMFPVYLLAKDNFPPIQNPKIDQLGNYFSESLFYFFAMYDDSKIVALPDNEKMKEMMMNTPRLYFMISGIKLEQFNITLPKRDIYYCNTTKQMENKIYESDSNGIAIKWENWNDQDCYENPIFDIYSQYSGFKSSNFHIFLELEIFSELKQASAKLAFDKKHKSFSDSYLNSSYTIQMNNPNYPTILPPNVNFSMQEYSRPKITKKYPQASLILSILITLTFILASMPDMEIILSEKDTHVSALMMIMGMTESVYWFVNFLSPFILCLIGYIISSLVFSFWFGMKGSDFTLLLVASILFIISQLWLLYFLSVFIQKASNGRILTVVMIIFVIFISYMHSFLTLDEDVSNMAIRNIVCIIPFSAYELFMMQGYAGYIEKSITVQWNDMNNKGYVCPLWIPLMWLAIDCFIYFFLFVILNSTYQRPFGTPIIKWREILDKEAWKRIFQSPKSMRVSSNFDEFIEVHDLKKVYHGTRDVTAIEKVSFDIKSGEVIAMIGPNGAGKSTLINIIAGAIEPSDGYAKIFGGIETKRFKEIQKYLGICFQDNVIIDLLSVREHFELFGAIRGLSQYKLGKFIDYFSSNMQLTEMLNNRAGDLSGGQKRKLCIGLSLIGNPPVVIMDEPTTGVDVQARQLIWKMISSFKNTTTIVTSHALEEAEAVSSRLFIVSGGNVSFCGTSTELRNQYKCGYLLRVERKDGTAGPVLDLAKSFIPEAHIIDDRKDTIAMPINSNVPNFLEELEKNEDELGVYSYSFSVEKLEDMLLKLIESEEVNQK